MHQNRIDKKWGSWQQIQEIDNETEWKTLIGKEMFLNAAHGGIKEDGDSGKVAMWFKSMRERKTWSEARAYRQNSGDDLFSDSDGTREELDLLSRKMGSEDHWVGMYTEDFTVWKTINGQVFLYDQPSWSFGWPLLVNDRRYAALLQYFIFNGSLENLAPYLCVFEN